MTPVTNDHGSTETENGPSLIMVDLNGWHISSSAAAQMAYSRSLVFTLDKQK